MKENFKNIDNFLNHICNYDDKTKENLLDFIIGTKYNEEKILNILGYAMTGKTTFLKLMNKVNELRKFVPFIINEIENNTKDVIANTTVGKIYVNDLLEILPLYKNIIIINYNDHNLKELFSSTGKDSDMIETLNINNKFIKTKEEINAILDNDEINAFADFLDNEFERKTNLKIEDTKSNLKYIEDFDYFLPTNATTKDINKIYIADILFNQRLNPYSLKNLLKNGGEVYYLCKLLPSPRLSDILRCSNLQNLDEIINKLKDNSEE